MTEPYPDAAIPGGPAPASKLAVWSLVLAVLPLCVTQLAAIPLSIIAISNIQGSGGRLGGKGIAIAALVLSLVCGGGSVFVVPIVAAIAIPGLMRSRIGTNESSAMGSLRSLATAQEQFKQQAIVDQDGDGMGEYGWLGELSGFETTRGAPGSPGMKLATSPFIASILRVKDSAGRAQKSGYMYLLFLPTKSRKAVAEPPGPAGSGDRADADPQEDRWACYAWPHTRGASGNRAFFVNQSGEVWATAASATSYSGTSIVPRASAALDRSGPDPENLDAGVGSAAAGLSAGDGNTWIPAGN